MKFYLGTHHASQRWFDARVPLFVSRRVLKDRKKLPRAQVPWALDSGGFTELSLHGHWQTSVRDYADDVRRFEAEIGMLEWVAPMDWMCEPHILARTGCSVSVHQDLTIENFARLRHDLGYIVVPVLQGWSGEDYLWCWEKYEQAGFFLEEEPVVGLGTICRRQNMAEAGRIVRDLHPLNLHGFGVKLTGLESFGDALVSADSLAWSYAARRSAPIHGHQHKSCSNCLEYALRWREQVRARLAQQRLEVAA